MGGVVVLRRVGRQRTVRRVRLSGSGAAEFGEASFELYVEAAVEDRVDGAVEQSQRLGEYVDGLGDVVFVLGPDVDQVQMWIIPKCGSDSNLWIKFGPDVNHSRSRCGSGPDVDQTQSRCGSH